MSGGNENGRAICPSLVDTEVLADYWLGALEAPDEEAVELHLLACDRCGDRLREVIALADAIRDLAGAGALHVVVSDTFLRRARENGLRVREYAPPVGGSVACTVTADDDLLIARLAADVSDAGRVDLCFCDEHGVETMRLPDVPVHPGARDVALQVSMTFMREAPDHTVLMRMVAGDDGGGGRVLGEYTFHHQRTLPGPGA